MFWHVGGAISCCTKGPTSVTDIKTHRCLRSNRVNVHELASKIDASAEKHYADDYSPNIIYILQLYQQYTTV